ncbi:hypothetical protein NX059_001775 [Plenodomus lindquistii]|nr:hypothetical protein NX059_001775 [Plenodomus lindquistii]
MTLPQPSVTKTNFLKYSLTTHRNCGICSKGFHLDHLPTQIHSEHCQHVVGRPCLDKWWAKHNTCPVCHVPLFAQLHRLAFTHTTNEPLVLYEIKKPKITKMFIATLWALLWNPTWVYGVEDEKEDEDTDFDYPTDKGTNGDEESQEDGEDGTLEGSDEYSDDCSGEDSDEATLDNNVPSLDSDETSLDNDKDSDEVLNQRLDDLHMAKIASTTSSDTHSEGTDTNELDKVTSLSNIKIQDVIQRALVHIAEKHYTSNAIIIETKHWPKVLEIAKEMITAHFENGKYCELEKKDMKETWMPKMIAALS